MGAACSSLLPEKEAPVNLYSLDYLPAASPLRGGAVREAQAGAIVIVTPPRAAPGFDRPRMVYLREPYHIEHFAQNQWVEPPQRMLAPLLTAALESSGRFRAVLQASSAAAGEVRLNTEILRLQHEFFGTPSQVRFTLRASLVDEATRKVISTRIFEAIVDASSASPYGGVQAANQAVNRVLQEVAAFCAEQAIGSIAPAGK
jgi:cholesterol transport system auxiliary component